MSRAVVPMKAIRETLERNGGNIRAAAETLGLRRNSVYERLQREGFDVVPLRACRAPLVRVLPEQAERIRRGRRRLAVALDADLDDTDLLAQFIGERFEAWIEEKVSAGAERQS